MTVKKCVNRESEMLLKSLCSIAGIAVLLAGCSGPILERNLNSAMGQHVDVLIASIGLPDSETNVAGRRILIWANQQAVITPIYTSAYTTGYVGPRPFTATGGATTFVPTTSSCQLRVGIDSANRINHWDFNGNEAGCRRYANALAQRPIAPAVGRVVTTPAPTDLTTLQKPAPL